MKQSWTVVLFEAGGMGLVVGLVAFCFFVWPLETNGDVDSPTGLPPRGCAAPVNVLAGFMSERATGTAFGSTSCVGGGGTSAASTEWFAGKEASNAPSTTS